MFDSVNFVGQLYINLYFMDIQSVSPLRFFGFFLKVLERYLVKLRSSSFLIFFKNLFVCLCVMSDDYLMVSIFLLSQLHI